MADTFDSLAEHVARLPDVVRGRYAPSPTGPLHLGNARTALLAWLQVRLRKGTLVMRMEDLDRPRVRPDSAKQMLLDLEWLGLDWDEGPGAGGAFGPYDQSDRDDLYQHALRQLHREGVVFPCYCSRKDIFQALSAPHREQGSNVYPGTCRHREGSPDHEIVENGRRPSWRYRVPARSVEFTDVVYGPYRQSLTEDVGDFVLRRTDGLFAYQLAVVVDDALMGITDVVRGCDLLDSTPRQIELFRALEFPVPRFWHMPLVLGDDGRRLAKRDAAHGLTAMRQEGVNPNQLIGDMAAALGFVAPGTLCSARQLLEELDPDRFLCLLKAAENSPEH